MRYNVLHLLNLYIIDRLKYIMYDSMTIMYTLFGSHTDSHFVHMIIFYYSFPFYRLIPIVRGGQTV